MTGLALSLLMAAAPAFAGPVDDARALLKANDPVHAAEFLRQRLDQRPDDVDARFYLGEALSRMGRFSEAAAQFETVLSSRPDHHDALLGLERIKRYEGRWDAARRLLDRAAKTGPNDPDVAEERERLDAAVEATRCAGNSRWTARIDYLHEALSFAGRGNGTAVGVDDAAFHGWRAHADAAYARRFGLSDAETSVSATHALPWRSYGGGSLGVSAAGGLFPRLRLGAIGGIALGGGLSLETLATYRHYDSADIFSLAPGLYWETPWTLVDVAYSAAQTLLLGGAQSGVLSSYRMRARLTRYCLAKPWVAYARTREPFEPGNAQIVNAFSADHWLAGADFNVPGGWTLSPSFEYESRPSLMQHIDRWGLGLSRKFGRLPSIAGW